MAIQFTADLSKKRKTELRKGGSYQQMSLTYILISMSDHLFKDQTTQ